MKIGIDGRLWNETGVGRYIRNLVWELQKLDKENEYILFINAGQKIEELKLENEKWKIVKTNIHWHSLREQMKFPQVLYKENLDLMHFPYFSLPVFYNKPFVVTIHDLIINHFPTGKASTLPYPLYRAKRFGYDFVIKHAVTNSQKIIVPLEAVKDDVLQTFNVAKDKIVVTYEGVEKSSLRAERSNPKKGEIASSPSAPRNDDYFLYVGNAYPHKNLAFLLTTFLAFKKETDEDIKLILVGKDDFFYKRLRQKFATENFDSIEFRHNVSDEELFFLYANAKAFISPSLMEGFGLPPLEAMSSSCPVLVSDIPAFREVCNDAAFYFDQKNEKSLKEKMKLLLTLDEKTQRQHITKGLERVTQFSWEKMAKETLAVYTNSSSK